MKDIYLVGGSGFIGTRLAEQLINNRHFNVNIIDKALSKFFPNITTIGDVRDKSGLSDLISNKSIIINLAAEHRDDVKPISLYSEVNINGARNICDVARKKEVQTIIFTSTTAVYGFGKSGIDENGEVNPFNEYGRTKYEAEKIFKAWQAENSSERTLVIIRPTVVFGERNRGNVYRLLSQIASGSFIMVGNGNNCKSIAYVDNLTAFIEHSFSFKAGIHVYNFVDKPDFSMNELVLSVNRILGRNPKIQFRIPYIVAFIIGKFFDFLSILTGSVFSVSSIRIKKFCANSVYETNIRNVGFESPIRIEDALEKTIRYEFVDACRAK
jgi:nucleoside-diphosphate-sugar epimerase